MINLFKVFMSDEALIEVPKVLSSGYIGEGPKVKAFEDKLRKLFENDYVVTTNSGTSAEHLALHLLKDKAIFSSGSEHYAMSNDVIWPGIEPGDQILASPMTCTASNWPILANGFRIKWVDIDPLSLNMDLDDLARKIDRTTKAIMLPYWGGTPVDIDKLEQILWRARNMIGFSPIVIQDCAHGIGTTYKKKHVANYGFISTFSFQAIKHLTCGDGGALVLPYKELYDRAKLVRWYGIDREGDRKDFRCEGNIKEYGFKFHMNDISATIGLCNIEHLDTILTKHCDNAKFYLENIPDHPDIIPECRHLSYNPGSSYWIFTMLVDRREDFMRHMAKNGIQVSRVHERNDKHTCVEEYLTALPSLESVINKMICIPVGWFVTEQERQYIADTINKGW